MKKLSLILLLFILTGCEPAPRGYIQNPRNGTPVKTLIDLYFENGEVVPKGTEGLITFSLVDVNHIRILTTNGIATTFNIRREWFTKTSLNDFNYHLLQESLYKN